jgi:protein SCO1/2
MNRRLAILLGVLAGLVVVSVFAFVLFQPIQVLPRIRLAPGFALTDQDGQRLTNEDLRGQLVLYTITYTGCAAPCPQTGETMHAVQEGLKSLDLGGTPVKLVSISIDPANDTAERLLAAARLAGADPQTWRFAAGRDPAALKTIIGGGFEIFYEANPAGGYTFDPVYILVDGWGIIRGEYRYKTLAPDANRILRHIGVLVNEIRNSQGAARFAYEAAHLFLCYAR